MVIALYYPSPAGLPSVPHYCSVYASLEHNGQKKSILWPNKRNASAIPVSQPAFAAGKQELILTWGMLYIVCPGDYGFVHLNTWGEVF